MIIRIFRAVVQHGQQNKFEKIVKEQSIPMLKNRKGVIASYAGRPYGSNSDEFTFVTIWKDLADLKAFAGKQWEESVILPDEIPLLKQTYIHHFEVFHKETHEK